MKESTLFSQTIKASDEEIEWLYDLESKEYPPEIMRGWIKKTNKIVLLTRGSKGTRVYRNNETIAVPARQN